MQFDLARAIARSERRDNLRAAEENGAWVIRRSRYSRVRSKNECEKRVCDSLTCFHERSYTMPCAKCKRSKSEAKINLESLKRKLSIA